MSEDPTPYIKSSDEMINKPAYCSISNEELELDNSELVYLNEDFQPLSDEYQFEAEFVAAVRRATGTPWNGIHPETGEPQALKSTVWWKLIDVKPI